jgi:putative DNA primase/helicase
MIRGEIPKNARVLLVTDGKDAPDSPAAHGFQKGIDHLLSRGCKVQRTETPADDDVNSIWTDPERGGGKRAVKRLLAKPVAALLSFEGRVGQLATLPPTAYEQARREAAKQYGVRTGHVDKEVVAERRRRHPRAAGEDEAPDPGKPVDDAPWVGDVDLAAALDAGVTEARRYLSVPDYYCDVMSLWSAASHCVESEEIGLSVMPQFGALSRLPGAGKSIALQCIAAMAYRGQARSSYTAATLFRRIHQYHVTYCLTELHNILHGSKTDLLAIINACHRRDEAYVDRVEQLPDGSRKVQTFQCWAALAWGAIGLLPQEMFERAIVLLFKPALPSERDRRRRGSPRKSKVFVEVRRQFAAWAASCKSLPDVELPAELYNRVGDNWWVLFAVAEAAGGHWPQRVRAAATAVLALDRPESFEGRLITGIWHAFEELDRRGQKPERLTTVQLLARLHRRDTQEELGLREANHDRELTAYWLRENLRDLIENPKRSQEWQEGNGQKRHHVRGYYRSQFEDSFSRYLNVRAQQPGETSGTSGTSATKAQNPSAGAKISVPDGIPDGSTQLGDAGQGESRVADAQKGDAGPDPGQEKSGEIRRLEGNAPDAPDVSDTPGVGNAHVVPGASQKPQGNRGIESENGAAAPITPAELLADSAAQEALAARLELSPVALTEVLYHLAQRPRLSLEQLHKRTLLPRSTLERILQEIRP